MRVRLILCSRLTSSNSVKVCPRHYSDAMCVARRFIRPVQDLRAQSNSITYPFVGPVHQLLFPLHRLHPYTARLNRRPASTRRRNHALLHLHAGAVAPSNPRRRSSRAAPPCARRRAKPNPRAATVALCRCRRRSTSSPPLQTLEPTPRATETLPCASQSPVHHSPSTFEGCPQGVRQFATKANLRVLCIYLL